MSLICYRPEWKIARTAFSIRQLKRRMEERPRPYPLTSMIEYYYDPRIAVAWCRRNGVPVEEVISVRYNVASRCMLASFSDCANWIMHLPIFVVNTLFK